MYEEKYKFLEAARKAVPRHWLGHPCIPGIIFVFLLGIEAYRVWHAYLAQSLAIMELLFAVLLLCGMLAVWVMVHKKNQVLNFCTSHDLQTHLPLRYTFRRRAQEIIDHAKADETYAFVIIRLDQYHLVNFVMGLPASEEVIKQLYFMIADKAKPGSVIGQMSNRMLGVMFKYDNVVEINRFVLAVKENCKQGIKEVGVSMEVSVHVGVALYPKDGDFVPDIVRRAVYARYYAEQNHLFYAYYDKSKDKYNKSHLSIVTELREAMKTGALELYYQPKYNVKKQCVDEVEALMRWNHPERGVIGPGEFIVMAEKTDFINEITGWVIETAIRQCKTWEEKNINVKVAVNLSIKDVVNVSLMESIPQILEIYAVHPSKLMVEITETEIMKNPRLVIENLKTLRSHGIGIALDDFGTGMSSLEYIKILPIQELKLDRCFVMNAHKEPRDLALIKSVQQFGEQLGFSIVAEGCEIEASFRLLCDIQCTRIQGYYLSRPLAAADFEDWLAHSGWKVATMNK